MRRQEPQRTYLQSRYGKGRLLPGFSNSRTPIIAETGLGAAPNDALLVRFTLDQDWPISKVRYKVVTQNGDIDIGVYDEDFLRVFSTGAFACPAAGKQETSLTPTRLEMGKIYFSAFSADDPGGLAEFTVVAIGGGIGGFQAYSAKGLKHVQRLKSPNSHPLPADISGTVESDLGYSPRLTFL